MLYLLAAYCYAAGSITLPPGDAVYFGSVFPLDSDSVDPSFVYERRVGERAGGLVSTHITRDSAGEVVVADSAAHDLDYHLVEYALLQDQLGRTGMVVVVPGGLTFRFQDDDGEHTRTESTRSPVVAGPTLVGYLLDHLDALEGGASLDVRFVVLDRLRTIGFELRAVPAEPGQVRVQMRASSAVFGLLVHPLYFTFDDAGHILTMEGRVPPKEDVSGHLRALDARVEYRFVADTYR
jgi:hypothetical protein